MRQTKTEKSPKPAVPEPKARHADPKPTQPSYPQEEPKPQEPKPQEPKPQEPKSKPKAQEPKPTNTERQDFHDSTKTKRNKVLFVGDSISSNVEVEVLESAMNAEIKTVKAYAAIFDNIGNVAKKAARFPAKNMTDVTQLELEKEAFDILLLQSGSVDITNLETKNNPEVYSEYFKQEVVVAAKNLVAVAENALRSHSGLKKVIILNQTPRYDEKLVDPLGLKSAFVQLYNNTLLNLWIDSPLKSKFMIGVHNLECSGGIKEARYRDSLKKKYDGLHLFGPSGRKAYTVSILNILKSADLFEQTNRQTALQYYKDLLHFQYQKMRNYRRKPESVNDWDSRHEKRDNKSARTQKQRFNVHTSNVFEHLNY